MIPNKNEATIRDLENITTANSHLTFDEYAAIKEPSLNVIINDFAVKAIEAAKERGEKLTLEEARDLAKREIPAAFVPEWMKNLRIGANVAGMELTYLEQLKSAIDGLTELVSVIADGGGYIDRYIERHAKDFKRTDDAEGGEAENGNG